MKRSRGLGLALKPQKLRTRTRSLLAQTPANTVPLKLRSLVATEIRCRLQLHICCYLILRLVFLIIARLLAACRFAARLIAAKCITFIVLPGTRF